MTDAEIEQERQRIEPPLEPLYVDSKADIRSVAILETLAEIFDQNGEPDTAMYIRAGKGLPYNGEGSMIRPFLTVDEAREVQKPGQSIVIAGYATIGAASKPPVIPQEIKERCS